MDTSFWKTQFPHIKITAATKQFYNQYYYRLEIYAPGCKSIRNDDIGKSLDQRRSYSRDYNHGGSWWDKKLKEHLDLSDIGFLYALKDLFYEYPDIKIRTEEPKVTIYASDELMIQSVAKSIDPDHHDKIITITGPSSDEIKSLLRQNIVLVKNPPKYKYRIWFKEKQFDQESRHQILTYLQSLGDLVRMSDHTRDNLSKPHNWIWGSYFYTNDKGVETFIKLINPDIIREVSELVCLK